jgi:hypothetical protein
MSRSLILTLAFVAFASGQSQLDEYGFVGTENYDHGQFKITAQRFKDVTGAYAASLEPANKNSSRVGNYLVSCEGKCPKDLESVADASLPHVSHGSLPTLSSYFPSKNLIARSQRYILGPVGLEANAPEIPASAVNFDVGTEGEIGHYRTSNGDVTLGVFSFPTPSFARQQLPQIEKIPDATVKRTGPLVVVAVGAREANRQPLTAISYQGVVSENETPPAKPLELKPESTGQMVLAIFALAGIALAFCLVSGLAVGAILRLARRFGYSAAEGSLITLHLEGK